MPVAGSGPLLVALLAAARPPGGIGTGMVWCRTAAEVVVLAQGGRLAGAYLDGRTSGLDGDLVALVARHCPVAVVDPRAVRPDWEALGASVLAAAPAGCVAPAAPPSRSRPVAVAPLVAVLAPAPGEAVAASLAIGRSLARRHPHLGPVVVVDGTRRAPLRSLVDLHPTDPGLPELLAATRLGEPDPAAVDAARHRCRGRIQVVPGLRHADGWTELGPRSVPAALEAIRAACGVVVVAVDDDLDGEAETGSFDVEDRNLLARTAIERAGAVVVAARRGTAGRLALAAHLVDLDRAGTAGRSVVVHRTGSWSAASTARAVVHALGAPARVVAEPEPEAIRPGSLGHWAQEVDGWITPRVPQQP